ncbi:MAG: hypothetical protein PVJ57_20300 [Phycisphaerae bacterium]
MVRLQYWVVAALLSASVATGLAASHRDWTAVPLGSFTLQEGEQTIQLARPYDRFGVIPSPIVLAAVFEPVPDGAEIEIHLVVAGRDLPTWTVRQPGEMYVLGVAVQETLAGGGEKPTIAVDVTVSGAPNGLVLMASGSPELGFAGRDALGPLTDVIARLERGVGREYLGAVAGLVAGRTEMATSEFDRLSQDADPAVARFARAALRRLRFADAEARAAADFPAQYRLGLYAQQCGLSRAARLHFETALRALSENPPRPGDWFISDAWYRLGETMERCGEPIADVARVIEQAGRTGGVQPNVWDVWVVILLSKEYEETRDGERVMVRVDMTPEQIARIKTEWGWVEQMVYGASGGHYKLNTRYVEVPDETAVPYGMNVGWLYGPLDDIVPVRGSVDCVMSFHPRGPSVTGGADCGPNGAAMTDIGTWCGWEVYLHEWNHQFDWTLRTDEAGDGYPITHHSDSCGHQPIPSMGYGHRSSMRYYITPAMYHRMQPADVDPGAGHIRHWWIGQPTALAMRPAEGTLPSHNALRLFPPPEEMHRLPEQHYASATDFVDLRGVLAEREIKTDDWCVTPATAYVLSPRRQEVRLWLGHNDGMAVRLNDELIHRGDYYAIAKFEDQDWPNMVAIGATLRQGWNRLDVMVESWPAPRNHGYGFSVRICDLGNKPLPDAVVADESMGVPASIAADPLRPTAGKRYRWDDVRDDFYHRLPRLDAAALAEYAKLPESFEVKASIGATQGYVALGTPDDSPATPRGGVVLRDVPAEWRRDRDADLRLNNVLDWNREAVAVYPFGKPGLREPQRHYLVMRPEAFEAYFNCTAESPTAREFFSGLALRDRVLGYIQVGRLEGEAEGVRALIVVEAALPGPLPLDEEDLLRPLAE